MLRLGCAMLFVWIMILETKAVSGDDRHFFFTHLQLEDGLSQQTVLTIFQDTEQYIWIGTNDGLDRYDGYGYRRYSKEYDDPYYLEDNYIQKILQDSAGNIWVATGWSVNCIDHLTDRITHYRFVEEKREFIGMMHYTSDKRLLVFTENYLYLYDSQRDTFCLQKIDGEMPRDVLSIAEDVNGNFYLGTQSQGFFIYDRDFRFIGKLHAGGSSYGGQLPKGPIAEVWVESRDKIWMIANHKELLLYRPQSHEIVTVKGLYWVSRIIDWDETHLMAGGAYGLFLVDKNTLEVYPLDVRAGEYGGLSHAYVTSLCKDRNGDLWVGTFYGGVNYFNQYNLRFDFVRSIEAAGVIGEGVEDANGVVWFGMKGGGLLAYDMKTRTQRNYWIEGKPMLYGNVKSVIRQGTDIYLSLNGAKVYRFSIPEKKFYLIADYGVGDIIALYKDSGGRLWIPTNSGAGLVVLDQNGQAIDSLNLCKRYSRLKFIVSVLEIEKNVFLFGTRFCGVYFYNGNTGECNMQSLEKWGLNQDIYLQITSILKDGKGDIWVATKRRGLFRLDSAMQLKERYTQADGLPARIYGIAEHNGDIWLMNSKEFYRLDVRQRKIKRYPAIEELTMAETSVNALFKGSGNRLFLPGTRGFLVVNPDVLTENAVEPPVLLTDLKVDNQIVVPGEKGSPLSKKLNLQGKLILRHDQTNISIGYLALNYLYPQQNRYAYRMLGLEDKWNEAGERREAIYNNLRPGTYTFQVKGSNNEGVWNEKGAELQIVILPPLWDRWWAWLGYLIVVSGIIYVVVRSRYQKLELERSLHLKELEQEKMKELAEEKTRFFTYAAHEFRTPLTLIINPLDDVLQQCALTVNVREALSLVRRSAGRMLSLVNSLLDIERREAGKQKVNLVGMELGAFIRETVIPFASVADSRKIDFNIEVVPEYLPGLYDKEQWESIISNLLSNAFKFTPEGGHIGLSLHLIEKEEAWEVAEGRTLAVDIVRWLYLRVKDDGIGISKEKIDWIFEPFYQGEEDLHGQIAGTGVGLSLIKSVVTQERGIIFARLPEKGTEMCILLPYRAATEEQMQQSIRYNERPDGRESQSKGREISWRVSELKILLVEDNSDALAYLEKQLMGDYVIFTAANGLEAWGIIEREVPDMVISDVMMPVMDGIALCVKLKEDFRFSHIPVILLTAKAMQSQVEEGFKAGADDYIVKPFSVMLLKVRIRNLFSNREQVKKTYTKKFSLDDLGFEIDKANKTFMERYVEIVRNNFRNTDFDADVIYAQMGMSRANFYKKLKSITDMSSNEIIRNIRLESAALLLKETKLSISEVAGQVGFSSVSYFGSCFKARYGMSPREFQNNTLGK